MSLSRGRRRISVSVADVTELWPTRPLQPSRFVTTTSTFPPRVFLSRLVYTLYTLFFAPTTIPRVWLPRYPCKYIYIYIFISQPFFRPAYKGRSDERVCNAVTRPCYRLANSSPPETRLSPAARNFSIFLTNVDYISSSSSLHFFSAKNLLCKLRSNFSTKISSFRKTLRNNFIVFPVQNEF